MERADAAHAARTRCLTASRSNAITRPSAKTQTSCVRSMRRLKNSSLYLAKARLARLALRVEVRKMRQSSFKFARDFVAILAALVFAGCASTPVAYAPPPPAPAWVIPGVMLLPRTIPKPSTKTQIERIEIVASDKSVSLLEVGERLERGLKAAGYSDFSYFQTFTDRPGFALVTQMERIEDDGSPKSGTTRFLPPGEGEYFSLRRYLASLVSEPVGYYRVIFFLVADETIDSTNAPMSGSLADAYITTGEIRLPREFGTFEFTRKHNIDVYVYEFQKKGDNELSLVPPVRVSADVHVARSGIAQGIARTARAGQ